MTREAPSPPSPPSPAERERGGATAAAALPEVRLQHLRGEIERIDRALVELLAERVAAARQVGIAKRELGLPTLDPAREAFIVRRASQLAREAGVSEEDARYIFWQVIGMSRRAQQEEG